MARQFRSPKMLKTWNGATIGQTNVDSTTQAILAGVAFTVGSRSTILRIRGNLLIKGTPDSSGDNAVVGLGLGIVTSDAAAVGGTSVPSPLGDPDWSGWMWHQYTPMDAGSAALSGSDIGSMARIEIDSKSMRKISVNESLVLIGVASTLEYAALVVSGGVRVLFGEF